METLPGILNQIDQYVRAQCPIIMIRTREEERVLRHLERMTLAPADDNPTGVKFAKQLGKTVRVWSAPLGLNRRITVEQYEALIAGGLDPNKNPLRPDRLHPEDLAERAFNAVEQFPLALFRAITDMKDEKNDKAPERGFYILRDLDEYLKNGLVVRMIRDCLPMLRLQPKTIFLVSNGGEIPAALASETVVIDYPLPAAAELDELVGNVLASLKKAKPLTADDRALLVRALQGMTEIEAEVALAQALAIYKTLAGADVLGFIMKAKTDHVKKSGKIEIDYPTWGFDQVGNMDRVAVQVRRSMAGFTPEAQAFGLLPPKGIMLAGPPGTGKTYMAKAVAREFNMPCLVLDMSQLVGSLLGETEKNVNAALAIAESVQPCVLVIDEAEKLFGRQGSMGGGGESSGGTMERVFGRLLSWMAVPGRQVYLVATSNALEQLPPEMIRSGRFDQVYFVDIPQTPEARHEILTIQLRQLKRDPLHFDRLSEVAEATPDFTGADLAELMQRALQFAWHDGKGTRDVSIADMVAAAKTIKPQSRTRKDDIARMRDTLEAMGIEPAATPQFARIPVEGTPVIERVGAPASGSRFDQMDE